MTGWLGVFGGRLRNRADRAAALQKVEGFTLLEIVASLIVASILAAILMQFMGTAVWRSAEPLQDLGNAHTLAGKMAAISSDYDVLRSLADGADVDLQVLMDRLDPANDNYGLVTADPAIGYATKYITFPDSGDPRTEEAAADTGDREVLKITLTQVNPMTEDYNPTISALFTRR